MGVVVRRYDILAIFLTPLVLVLFLAAASLLLCSFFFHSGLCYFCTIYSKRYSKNIGDRSKKSRSREYNY